MDAAAILAIPVNEPERLFPGDLAGLRKKYRELARRWHPDHNPAEEAGDVLAHINQLHALGLQKLQSGTWRVPGRLAIADKYGRHYQFQYRKQHPFEIGSLYIGAKHLVLEIPNRFEDHMTRGLRATGSLRYPDNRMRANLEILFPKVERLIVGKEAHFVVIGKTPDVVLLSDLLKHLGGQLDPKHTAWVISRLLGLASFFEITGRTHNNLTVDTIFVSPKYHSALLLHGWWYFADVGKPMVALAPAVYDIAPRMVVTRKLGDHQLDLECIRAVGRVCLGEPKGSSLRLRKDVPKPMADWLLLPAPASPIKDFENWQKVLTDSFGPRRFIELPVTGDAVYPLGG